MATSGSIDYTLDMDGIILAALNLLGVAGADTNYSLTNHMGYNNAKIMLNLFVKKINKRKPLFGVTEHTIPLYDEKQVYTIGASGNKNVNRPLSLRYARRTTTTDTTSEIEIDIIAGNDYRQLPTKGSTGIVNSCYYDQQLTQGKLYVWPVASLASVSLSDGTTDNFTDSPAVTGEYYYTGSSITAEPTYVFADGTELTAGTLGSLANGEYAWGDNDSLGADTLYVKTAAGDPDGQSADYIQVLTSTPDKLIITVDRPLEDFDASANTPDFPQEAQLMLVYNTAALIAPQLAPKMVGLLKPMADEFTQEYLTDDVENVSFCVHPSYE